MEKVKMISKSGYGLKFSTVNSWIENYKRCPTAIQAQTCRPGVIDRVCHIDLCNKIIAGSRIYRNKQKASVIFSKSELTACANKFARLTLERRGFEADNDYFISSKVIELFKTSINPVLL